MTCFHQGTHIISRLRPHQGDLIVAAPKQSPDSVELPLKGSEKTGVSIWTKRHTSLPFKPGLESVGNVLLRCGSSNESVWRS